MEQHCDAKPKVNPAKCIGCRLCSRICAHDAPTYANGKCTINHDRCVGCGQCIGICPKEAIEPVWGQAAGLLDKKMAEYALAVVAGRPAFYINIVMDVSPNCDCHPENDAPIVPDIGIFASKDPVALDQACSDAVNAQTPLQNSQLAEHGNALHDHLRDSAPRTNWKLQLEHGEKIGLGIRQYELIEMDKH